MEAEAAARKALELNPDNEVADNQLSMSLRMQDKVEESGEGVAWRRWVVWWEGGAIGEKIMANEMMR